MLKVTLAVSPSHSNLTLGQPVLERVRESLEYQFLSSWCDSTRQEQGSIPSSAVLKIAALFMAFGRFMHGNRLVGLVVKASASRAGGPGFESR